MTTTTINNTNTNKKSNLLEAIDQMIANYMQRAGKEEMNNYALLCSATAVEEVRKLIIAEQERIVDRFAREVCFYDREEQIKAIAIVTGKEEKGDKQE